MGFFDFLKSEPEWPYDTPEAWELAIDEAEGNLAIATNTLNAALSNNDTDANIKQLEDNVGNARKYLWDLKSSYAAWQEGP